MIKKIVKGTDFNGNPYEKEYWFHLTKGDLIDWAADDGGLLDKIMEIQKQVDPLQILPIMKQILIRSYGVRTPDGESFIKDPEDVKRFQYTDAFSELYTELSTNSDAASEFVNGIMPKFDEETQKKLEEARKKYEAEREKAE